ncbi:MAG: iron-containing alcohol dehydrogenase [Deltaproteobacteria bacterium]|jgi:NADP-dependent alcohol dehydrogenase|nr:iron-containing alcohol dehydrogenase [Deltaproteobacteria bacterium]
MLNFDFYNPTRILFGKDRIDEISNHIPSNAKVLITYGGGSAKKNGLIDKIKNALGKRIVLEFGGIEANPHFETLMKAVDIVRKENIDFLMAVGGGSVIDGTKFISIASYYKGNTENILKYGFSLIPKDAAEKYIPFGTVLTLPASGSEMNSGAVISHGDGKFPVLSEMAFPQFSLLDPALTYTLPAIQAANGIVDTFVHVTEQYLTYPVKGLLQDRIAEGILLTLIEIGKTSVTEPENYDARANHVWSSSLALCGIVGAGVPKDLATHIIGHEITASFGIDHAQTLAVVLPSMLKIRKDKKKEKLLQYAERVWNIKEVKDEDKIDKAIDKTREFFESLGIKTRLSKYGIKKEQIPLVIERLKEHGMTALSETHDLTPDISQKILEEAM